MKNKIKEAILKNVIFDKRTLSQKIDTAEEKVKNLIVIDGFINDDELNMIQQFVAFNSARQAVQKDDGLPSGKIIVCTHSLNDISPSCLAKAQMVFIDSQVTGIEF